MSCHRYSEESRIQLANNTYAYWFSTEWHRGFMISLPWNFSRIGLSFSRALVSVALKSHGVEGIGVNRSRIQKRKTRRAEIVCVNLTGIWIALKRSRRLVSQEPPVLRHAKRDALRRLFPSQERTGACIRIPIRRYAWMLHPGPALCNLDFTRIDVTSASSINEKIYRALLSWINVGIIFPYRWYRSLAKWCWFQPVLIKSNVTLRQFTKTHKAKYNFKDFWQKISHPRNLFEDDAR